MRRSLAYSLDEWREEIIGGKVVMMATPNLRHGFIVGNIYNLFFNYLRGKRCTPFSDNTKLFLAEGERYIPDVMVVCNPDKLKPNGVFGAPDLVVEVLSDSTARRDRRHKKDAYERCGVREYWIVSPGDQSIEQYVLENGAFVLRDVYTRHTGSMDELTEEERAELVTEFKCSLFDDLAIRLEDVFYRVTTAP